MPCKNTGRFFGLLTFFSRGFQRLLFLYQQLPLFCSQWEQPPPAPSILRQISCKRHHLAPWEATTACTAVVPSLWETGGGTEWEQATGCQLDHAQDALKKIKKNPPLSFSFSYSVLGLAPSILCHFKKLLNSNFFGGEEGFVTYTLLPSAIVSSIL